MKESEYSESRTIQNILQEFEYALNQPEICKRCGGTCCKKFGCQCHPMDFNYDVGLMRRALLSGNYSIDFSRKDASCFIQSGNGFYLSLDAILQHPEKNCALCIRARNANRPVVDLFHGINEKEGPCAIWSQEKGCQIPFDERPLMAKVLRPMGDFELCFPIFERDFFVEAWRRYQLELYALGREFFDPRWARSHYGIYLHW